MKISIRTIENLLALENNNKSNLEAEKMDTMQTEAIKNSVLQSLDEYFKAARSGDPQRFL